MAKFVITDPSRFEDDKKLYEDLIYIMAHEWGCPFDTCPRMGCEACWRKILPLAVKVGVKNE